MWRETFNHIEAKAFFAEVFKAKMSLNVFRWLIILKILLIGKKLKCLP